MIVRPLTYNCDMQYNLLMSSPDPAPDLQTADAISRAEHRRELLAEPPELILVWALREN